MSARTSAPSYPWETLEVVPLATVRAIRALGPRALELAGLCAGLGQVLARDTEAVFKRFCDPAPIRAVPWGLHFSLEDGSLGLFVEIEPALADGIVAGLLRQVPGVAGAEVLRDPTVRGFLGRVGVEAGRNSNPPVELRFHSAPLAAAATSSVGVSVTLLLDGKPYAVRAVLSRLGAEQQPVPGAELRQLGTIALALPLLGGVCLAQREELTALALGDVLVPGAGCWLTTELGGSLALCSDNTTRAVFFEIVGERSAKLVGVEDLPVVEDTVMSENSETEVERSVAEAVLDAPVVVRIEVASVSMTAAAFANLRPGAVVETEQRIGQLATLRVAGREVATGELVNVDGQLGVRIRKLLRGD
jgi:flagellar motor switch/type III secretory pathway protein FliN